MSLGYAPTIHKRHVEAANLSVDFPVQQCFSADHTRVTRATSLSEYGITLERMPDDGFVRHLWLRFTLPGTSGEIPALVELLRSSVTDRETRMRFVHLYPADRRRLVQFLDVHRAVVQAA
jgi:hypothetical protein